MKHSIHSPFSFRISVLEKQIREAEELRNSFHSLSTKVGFDDQGFMNTSDNTLIKLRKELEVLQKSELQYRKTDGSC